MRLDSRQQTIVTCKPGDRPDANDTLRRAVLRKVVPAVWHGCLALIVVAPAPCCHGPFCCIFFPAFNYVPHSGERLHNVKNNHYSIKLCRFSHSFNTSSVYERSRPGQSAIRAADPGSHRHCQPAEPAAGRDSGRHYCVYPGRYRSLPGRQPV